MSSYSASLKYLYGLQSRGMKLGLRNVRTILRAVGNPERQFRSIHVAGTNGKGSTSAFLASVLMETGLRTGLYTSPHLVRFTERVKIDGKEIPEQILIRYADRIRPLVESVKATFFEATTCIAFLYFADSKVDIAVLETGLGGRLDATNVVRPLVTVIAEISFDHVDRLGNTIGRIAREKAGTIKRGVPCVTSSTDPAALHTLRAAARQRRSPFYEARDLVDVRLDSVSRGRASVQMRSAHFRTQEFVLGLGGLHQISNARLAVGALEILARRRGRTGVFRRLSSSVVAEGLANVCTNTGLSGRLASFGAGGRYLVDVAHNAAGMRALVQSIATRRFAGVVAVFGAMKDKDFGRMLDDLARVARLIVLVAPPMKRAANPRRLLRLCRSHGIDSEYGGSVSSGLEKARILARPRERILVTGSHYVVGRAIQELERARA